MNITEIPSSYRTSDGKEHPSRDAAERHEELIQIRLEYERVHQKYGAALARTYKTADGQPFDLRQWHYYYVTRGYPGAPSVLEVSFYSRDIDFDHYTDDVVIYCNLGNERRKYRLNELYSTKAAAQAAQLARYEEWLEEHRAELEQLRRLDGTA